MLYAVGDIHGQPSHLVRLMLRIREDAARHGVRRPIRVVFLGDYGDRGPDSRKVFDLLTSAAFLEGLSPKFLRGNHEEWLRSALAKGPFDLMGWLHNGGAEFVESYGFDFRRAAHEVIAEFRQAFPSRHQDFLDGLALYHEEDGYLFVHAGIDPAHPTARHPAVLTWAREPFLSCGDAWPFVVVHGHSMTPEVVVRPNRIGIDTGCGHGPDRPLSAVALEGVGIPPRILDSRP